MLFNRAKFGLLHSTWLVLSLVITGVCGAWYASTWIANGRLPGGGSSVGFACGVFAGLICLFEFALVFKKTWLFRTCRSILGIPLGSARWWMAAHIWLGLLAVPLVMYHTSLHFGGLLSTLLAVAFYIVIASGVLGLVLQNILPKLMTNLVQEETIYSQIDSVGAQLAADAERLVLVFGGQPTTEVHDPAEHDPLAARRARERGLPVVGAARHVGTLVKLSRDPRVPTTAEREGSPELERALQNDVLEFLRTGHGEGGRLGSVSRLKWYFDDLREHVRPEAREVVEQLRALCERRRQLNLQSKIHFWLHCWLSVHLPLSVALVWLLVGHVVGALVYN
ncbi:MAG: hypothetical protein SFU86_11315 [Pirellulaceae bacterium]|nr:hypothetical protein [Pirellulaceae bacterium]